MLVGPLFAEVWAGRIRFDLPDGPLWAVSRAGLTTMKRLAAAPMRELSECTVRDVADAAPERPDRCRAASAVPA